jgi:hypothetical protein
MKIAIIIVLFIDIVALIFNVIMINKEIKKHEETLKNYDSK